MAIPPALSNSIFPIEVVTENAAKVQGCGIRTGSTAQFVAVIPAAGVLGYDLTKAAHVATVIGAAGAAVTSPVAIPVAAGIITIANGSTTGSAVIPAGISLATHRMTSSMAGSASTAVATSAPLFSIAGGTPLQLDCKVADPAGATSVYVSYEIYKA